jgi:hypothetical protein
MIISCIRGEFAFMEHIIYLILQCFVTLVVSSGFLDAF